MGVIFDTSILIEAERGRFDVDKFMKGREEEPFGLSVITVAELLHGVHRALSEKQRLMRSAYVERVIELFSTYEFDVNAARIYADLWAHLWREGIIVGARDLMIGSTALALGFSVATFSNRRYEKIEGLAVEVPG
jgi:tRNA(fMet)-specific endonuclease VapC